NIPQDKKDDLLKAMVNPLAGDPQAKYEDAVAAGASNSYNQQQADQAVNNAKTQQQSVQPPAQGGGGVQTSDDAMRNGEAGLKVFGMFMDAWKNRPSDCIGNYPALDMNKDITTRYQEQYGINFQKFLDDAGKFGTGDTTVGTTHTDVANQLNSLYKDWTGSAANASSQHYNNDIDPKIKELNDALHGASTLIPSTVQTVYTQCTNKADDVLKLYRDQVGQATPYMAGLVVKMAASDGNDDDDDKLRSQIQEISMWVDGATGSDITSRVNDDSCSLNQDNIQYCIDQCKKWVRDSFNTDFYGDQGTPGLYMQFKKICDDTKTQVDSAWQNLTDTMKKYQCDFPQSTAPVT
ncbi:MAG: WXG100 family type VII secretion target, partial [Candidatus Dormibacteraceae bacterium]